MSKQHETRLVRTDDADWRWQPEALDDYISGNYLHLAPEDQYVGAVAISALATIARQRNLLHALPFGTHISAGAVPRGSATIEPLILPTEQGGYIDVSDLEESTTNATRHTMSQLALGDLGLWTPHQEDFAAIHPLWEGSFQAAGKLAEGHVHMQDMRLLTPGTHHIIAVEHGPESATAVEDEYQEFIRIICNALLPGGILYMAYMRGSEGYEIGGVTKPAFPVTVDYVSETLHSNNMHVFANAGTDPSNTIRTDGDEHAYTGLGAVVAIHN